MLRVLVCLLVLLASPTLADEMKKGRASGRQSPPVACTFEGQTVAHGHTIKAFQYPTVEPGSICPSELRTCDNGILSGSFRHVACAVIGICNCPDDKDIRDYFCGGRSRKCKGWQINCEGREKARVPISERWSGIIELERKQQSTKPRAKCAANAAPATFAIGPRRCRLGW